MHMSLKISFGLFLDFLALHLHVYVCIIKEATFVKTRTQIVLGTRWLGIGGHQE